MLWVYGHYNILILSARGPALTLSHVFLFPLVFSVVLSTYDEITALTLSESDAYRRHILEWLTG